MPRNPDVPCDGCGKLCWPSKKTGDPNYRPPSQHYCLDCRRSGRVDFGSCEVCGKPKRSAAGRACGKRCQYLLRMAEAPECSTPGCDRPAFGRGLCAGHYSAVWRSENRDKKREIDQRRRALKEGAYVEAVDRVKVFARDGWRCHLCGKRIDPTVKFPDRMAATVDHVIPLAKGGEHSMQNSRAAHYSCNAAKGARGGNEQLVLF